jgi:hypothetical protein
LCDNTPEILLNQRQRHFYSSRAARRAIKLIILYEGSVLTQPKPGETLRNIWCETPVRGHEAAVKQTALRKGVDTGGDSGHPSRMRRALGQPKGGVAPRFASQ